MKEISAAVFHADVHHRTQGVGTIGRKGSGVKVHGTDKIGIKDAHRSACCSLRGEVVDDGQFNAIEVKHIFGWSSASHQKVVAVGSGGSHTREGLHEFRHVTVHTSTLFDLSHFEGLHRERTLSAGFLGARSDDGFGERHLAFVHRHIDEGGLVTHHLQLFGAFLFIAQKAHGDMVKSRFYLLNHIVAHGVGDGGCRLVFESHDSSYEGFVVAHIDHAAFHHSTLRHQREKHP